MSRYCWNEQYRISKIDESLSSPHSRAWWQVSKNDCLPHLIFHHPTEACMFDLCLISQSSNDDQTQILEWLNGPVLEYGKRVIELLLASKGKQIVFISNTYIWQESFLVGVHGCICNYVFVRITIMRRLTSQCNHQSHLNISLIVFQNVNLTGKPI